MKEFYSIPEIKIVGFQMNDVITVSLTFASNGAGDTIDLDTFGN